MDMIPANRDRTLDELVNDWNKIAPRHDAWPNSVQLVNVDRIDTIAYALEIGRRLGYCSIDRMILTDNVGHKGVDHVIPAKSGVRQRIQITRPGPVGTDTIVASPNFVVVTSPAPGEWWTIELGCHHEMQRHSISACYYKSKCAKCGYEYAVDSSD